MAGNGDMQFHESTYSGFMRLLKWGTILSVAIAAIVVLLIAG